MGCNSVFNANTCHANRMPSRILISQQCYFLALGFNLKTLWLNREENRLQPHLSAFHIA